MTTFSVWAPAAGRVELDLGDRRLPMAPGHDEGWWSIEVAGAEAGRAYWFILDGGDPRPDPRSPWQPDGVFGPSCTVDHDAFSWTDQGWRGLHLPSTVLYELHVGTFTPAGTFDGVVERLDHLVSLGVTAIELLPVAEASGGRGWGYDGVDLFAPHHGYGGPDGLKRLVDACHARGLGVVLDVVYNHLGPAGSYLHEFGPYFTDRYATPWGSALNLDGPDSGPVREFFLSNAEQWLRDYHCDGLRLDAVHAIVDSSAVHLLEELAGRVERLAARLGRPLSLIAESDLNDPRIVRSRDVGGYGMDAQWSDDLHHALHAVLAGETSGYYADFGRLEHVAVALRRAFVYAGDYSPHRRRAHGRYDPSLPGRRFLGYLQNHDQVGNRAAGERSSILMSVGRQKIGAALVLCAPFIPMLFQGEEWGATTPFLYFTDHADPDLGRAVSEGRRREFAAFGWAPEDVPDPQSPVTFERSRLDWDEPGRAPHADLLDWHRALIRLRKMHPDLLDDRLDRVAVEADDSRELLWLRRGEVTVVANFGRGLAEVEAGLDVLLRSDAAIESVGPGRWRLPPDSVAITAGPSRA